MLRKLRRSRSPAGSGAPTFPDLRVGHRPGRARARPPRRARSRAGEELKGQVFVAYRSPQGFSLKVPVSWARTTTPSSVVFADTHRRIEVSIVDVTASSTRLRAWADRSADSSGVVAIHSVREAKLPAGRSIQIRFTSSFQRSPATNYDIRLDSERYLIIGYGKIAVLTLCAPALVETADLWKLIAASFRW